MKAANFELIHVTGPVGQLETLKLANQGTLRGIALVAHPNPLEGGTFTNKIVHVLAKALSRQGYIAYCPNLRGVGHSEGQHDQGRGEVDDMASILAYARAQHGRLPIVLAGFSFGTFVQSQLRAHLNDDEMDGMILVGSAVGRYDFPTVPADTLVIHGEIDDITPLADTINWARPQNLPVVIVPDTGHFFHGKLAILNTLIDLRWRPRSSSFFQ